MLVCQWHHMPVEPFLIITININDETFLISLLQFRHTTSVYTTIQIQIQICMHVALLCVNKNPHNNCDNKENLVIAEFSFLKIELNVEAQQVERWRMLAARKITMRFILFGNRKRIQQVRPMTKKYYFSYETFDSICTKFDQFRNLHIEFSKCIVAMMTMSLYVNTTTTIHTKS